MPGSNYHQLDAVVGVMVKLKPRRILDVGVGFGKYGVLAREYLDLWEGEEKGKDAYRNFETIVDGIEVYKEYLTPLHDFVYNHVYAGDAANVVPTLKGTYDLALFIDVIEHMGKEEGLALLRNLLKKCRNVIVSTPHDIGHQHALFGNPHEHHVFQWEPVHFEAFPKRALIPNDASLIYVLGEDAEEISALARQREWAALKRSIRTLFPFLVAPYLALKRLLRHVFS